LLLLADRVFRRLLQNGSVDASFRKVSDVSTFLQLRNGKILIAGGFNELDGVPVRGLALLDANGDLDPSFKGQPDRTNTVVALSQQNDGRILVGGIFNSFNGTPSPRLVRLLESGEVDSTWRTGKIFTEESPEDRGVAQIIPTRDGVYLFQLNETWGGLQRVHGDETFRILPPASPTDSLLKIGALPRFDFQIEVSTDLTHWEIKTNVTATDFLLELPAPTPAPGENQIFVRVLRR
jgi:hypothetical protein